MWKYIVGLIVVANGLCADNGNGEVGTAKTGIDTAFFQNVKKEIETLAEPNVIASPGVIKSFVKDVNAVEQLGSPAQQKEIKQLMSANQAQIKGQLAREVKNFLSSPELRRTLGFIFKTALKGAALPLVVIVNQYISGHIPALGPATLATVEASMMYGAMLAMIKVFRDVAFTTPQEKPGVSGEVKTVDDLTLQVLDVIAKDASFFVVPQTAITDEVTEIVTESIASMGGISKMLKIETPQEKIEFGKSTVFGKNFESKYRSPIKNFADKISFAFHDKRVREVVAQVLFSAVEGAAVAAAFYFFGISFSEEIGVGMTMLASATRGATMGLLNYFVHRQAQPGALQNASTALIIRSAQNVLQFGSPELAAVDIAPAVVKEIAASAVETAVNNMGGWQETAQTIGAGTSTGVSSRWGSWYRNAKEKATRFFKWMDDDLQRSAEAGAL